MSTSTMSDIYVDFEALNRALVTLTEALELYIPNQGYQYNGLRRCRIHQARNIIRDAIHFDRRVPDPEDLANRAIWGSLKGLL